MLRFDVVSQVADGRAPGPTQVGHDLFEGATASEQPGGVEAALGRLAFAAGRRGGSVCERIEVQPVRTTIGPDFPEEERPEVRQLLLADTLDPGQPVE